jgi:3-deoxy-manno-octulosonate cytidylyltransferase (CMP-KDO synthetase)
VRVVGIIPARYGSTRLPGKALADICGKTMVERVYRRASAAACLDALLVATDDERILREVQRFGGEARMTSPNHQSGTDRLAEVAELLEADVVVNIQGDEPLLHPEAVERVIAPLLADQTIPMATLRTPLTDPDEIASPNVVKVVVDCDDRALYFSRCPIPFVRTQSQQPTHWLHIGLYAYRRDFLLTYARLPRTPLEQAESLEQLRALEHGYTIKVPVTDQRSVSVDSPADLERVRRLVAELGPAAE